MLATNQYRSTRQLCSLLDSATPDEKQALGKIVGINSALALQAPFLTETVCKEGGHSFFNLARGAGVGYLEIVNDVLRRLKAGDELPDADVIVLDDRTRHAASAPADADSRVQGLVEKFEQQIVIKALQVTYDGMDQAQRAAFDAHLNNVAKQFDPNMSRKIVGTAGIVALANMGGFATYTLLTTAMHAVAFGTLSFGAYTAAASLLHLVLGPVGWAALGGWAIISMGSPKMSKLVPIICNVSVVRQRIRAEHSFELRRK